MNKVSLLDCTLRDGGFTNDWAFGSERMASLLERLVASRVDIIEVGLLDARRPFDPERSILPDGRSVDKVFGRVQRGNAMILGMIDYGTLPLDKLPPCDECYLDGIRVIFKKGVMHEALEYCAQVMALGYKVSANCVSITSYNDQELDELIEAINKLKPFAVAIVDTYGLLHQEGLMHYFDIMDAKLLPEIELAYHAHNNFQMGYANGIEFLSRDTKRGLIIDGTLYGIGKSAGNTPLELLAMYMNEHFGKRYDISQMLDAIDLDIMELYERAPWGYKPLYFIAASNNCHPSYVSWLMNKGTLSTHAVNELLQRLEGDEKLLYNKERIEALYLEYQSKECNDAEAVARLKNALADKAVVAIGPGKTVGRSLDSINAHIRDNAAVTIAINYIPKGIKPDYLFITNSRRYTKLLSRLTQPEDAGIRLIATSNVSSVANDFEYVLNFSSLIDPSTEIPDNSLVMLMRLMAQLGVRSLALAGFDGYKHRQVNYFDADMEYSFVRDKVDYLNAYVKEAIRGLAGRLNITFVTPSRYEMTENGDIQA